jgi:signal transduction histidine kinase/CheY-like chemotaxis protein
VEEGLQAALAGKANIPSIEVSVGASGQFTRQIYMTAVGRGRKTKGGVVLYVLDATEQKALEVKYAQSQKMEAVGTLAGGIAHDFNNVLVGVLGNASLVRDSLGPNHAMHEALADICLSAKRAARLAGRMLTYSGGKPIQRGAVNLANLVAETITIVTAGVSKSTNFVVDDVDAELAVRGSAVELQQVLLNLLTNASESAQGAAVRVQVSAKSAELDAAFLAGCIGSQLQPGRYAVLCVEDNGAGIDPEIRPMMFDPFASTRGTGHGFGLASVLGIARAHAGALHVSDATPSGTRICVVLPLSKAKDSSQSGEVPAQSSGAGQSLGRVALVVDDEAMVRAFLRRALELQQFRVLEAADGEDALQQLAAHRLDLVVLDLTMPKLGGKEVLVRLRAERPRLPVILASGYTVTDAAAAADPHTRILQKPYALAALLTTIDELFAASKGTEPGPA